MFNIFCKITDKYKIDWRSQLIAQAYDGAASMQGQYSDLKTRIQEDMNVCNLRLVFRPYFQLSCS